MISIAVKGYGIVIWNGGGEWRTYTVSDAMSAALSTRVEIALDALSPADDSDRAVYSALLTIAGAHLLAVDCDHAPGECEGDSGRN